MYGGAIDALDVDGQSYTGCQACCPPSCTNTRGGASAVVTATAHNAGDQAAAFRVVLYRGTSSPQFVRESEHVWLDPGASFGFNINGSFPGSDAYIYELQYTSDGVSWFAADDAFLQVVLTVTKTLQLVHAYVGGAEVSCGVSATRPVPYTLTAQFYSNAPGAPITIVASTATKTWKADSTVGQDGYVTLGVQIDAPGDILFHGRLWQDGVDSDNCFLPNTYTPPAGAGGSYLACVGGRCTRISGTGGNQCTMEGAICTPGAGGGSSNIPPPPGASICVAGLCADPLTWGVAGVVVAGLGLLALGKHARWDVPGLK